MCVHTDISKIVLYRRSGSQRRNHNDSGDDFSTRCSIVSFADIIPAKHQHLNVFESADESIELRALRCTHRAASMTVNHLASLKLEGLHMHQCLLRVLFSYSCLDGPKSEFFRFKTQQHYMCVFRVHTNMQGNGHANCGPQGETTTDPLKEK